MNFDGCVLINQARRDESSCKLDFIFIISTDSLKYFFSEFRSEPPMDGV